MLSLLFTACTFFSTGLGGLAAVRFRDRLHLLLGFSSGAVLGVVFFDIFPELIQVSHEAAIPISNIMVAVACGFGAFFLLERITRMHGASEHEHHSGHAHMPELGVVGAAGLSVHSFLDGVAIGAGFQSGTALGIVIAVAVLTHDFSDGLNTVTVLLAHGNPTRRALRWLMVDASTPMLGALSVLAFHIPVAALPFILAFFCGFFLYISSSDLLPEAREHDSPWVGVAALSGLLLLFGITRLL